jgi:tripartite-type tricarboxylate transporter receptor subunit TctC
MKLPRRKFLHFGVSAAAFSALPRIGAAASYPSRPVRLVVGFPAGLAPDLVARLVGEPLSARLGQSVVVENRPGAGSNIATEVVVRAPADGYTLLLAVPSNAIDASLQSKLNFNFIRDIAPVAGLARFAFVMVTSPTVPAKAIPDFIAYAKANPGKINMASPGIGSATHVFGELFNMMAGTGLVHVPYRGSFFPDLVSGRVQVSFITVTSALSLAKIGNKQALAVTTTKRQALLPDVPAMGEFLPGYEAAGWNGIGAPKDMPAEIIGKLNNDINACLDDPGMKSHLTAMGTEPMPMTPAEFGTFIASETDKWAKVVKFADIRVD